MSDMIPFQTEEEWPDIDSMSEEELRRELS